MFQNRNLIQEIWGGGETPNSGPTSSSGLGCRRTGLLLDLHYYRLYLSSALNPPIRVVTVGCLLRGNISRDIFSWKSCQGYVHTAYQPGFASSSQSCSEPDLCSGSAANRFLKLPVDTHCHASGCKHRVRKHTLVNLVQQISKNICLGLS